MNVTDEAQVEKGVADTVAKYGKIDILVSNAGIQIVHPLVDFPFADWKKLLSIHLDGSSSPARPAAALHAVQVRPGRLHRLGPLQGGVQAQGALVPPSTASSASPRCWPRRMPGQRHRQRRLPGLRAHAAGRKQIPSRPRGSTVSGARVIKHDHARTRRRQFTTTDDVADAVLYFAAATTTALTGQSMVVSHGWFMQ